MGKRTFKLLTLFFSFHICCGLLWAADEKDPTQIQNEDLADELNLKSLEDFKESVSAAYKKWGSDQLAGMIAASGIRAADLQKFRREVRELPNDVRKNWANPNKLPVQVPFSDDELKSANLRLENSGLDFIQLVSDGTSKSYIQIPAKDVPKLKRWLAIRRFLVPAVALATAVTVGIILVKSGVVVSSSNLMGGSSASFLKRMSPFIGAGTVAFLSQAGLSFKLYPYKFGKTLGLYRPTNFFIKLGLRDVLIPVLIAFSGAAIAQFPPGELSYPHPTSEFFSTAAMASGLSVFSLGLAERALERLKVMGVLSQLKSIQFETRSALLLNMGLMTFLTSSAWWKATGIFAAYIGGVTLPIWYKILIGDRMFDTYTKEKIEETFDKRSLPAKACIWSLSKLSRVYVFTK
ncbi:MAG: hypothetical protein JWQ35_1045 [Bacteriovoracaceae bacterium]|nr:hypothetical protein [Bacteriovoracaceae bacterium]